MNTTMERRSVRAIASTTYDTAWVAAVPHPEERRTSRFGAALSWIAAQQLPDGSWGSAIPYTHDRILCTLAALIPLARYGRRESDHMQVQQGERYLWQHAHLLGRSPCELVGFELLLPTLADMAADAGVHVPPFKDMFAAERARKLALLTPELIYSPRVTTVHSLEFLGSDVDVARLQRAQAPNGSIGNSPAATAYLLHHLDNPAAVAYLERCLGSDRDEAVAVLEPCETFEALWVAYHRWLGGAPAHTLLSPALRSELRAALLADGVSLSRSFPIPDADDTAVALMLLHEAGVAVPPTALQRFYRNGYFVSFPYERHPSTGVNIHALQALLRYEAYPQRDEALKHVLMFLRDARQHGTYWLDKWHMSPFYATGRAVAALSELPAPYKQQYADVLRTAVDWIMSTQGDDGAWGFSKVPTAEETAYAVLALRRLADPHPYVRAALARGIAYLDAHRDAPHPAMWMDKCLYLPGQIVESVVDAARTRAVAPSRTHD